ncbi:hypothetical protein HBI27_204580 [Parastagonospora nodorum]|nr:hypothetical protein HBI27_204580 [Parastagonospora nodorum]
MSSTRPQTHPIRIPGFQPDTPELTKIQFLYDEALDSLFALRFTFLCDNMRDDVAESGTEPYRHVFNENERQYFKEKVGELASYANAILKCTNAIEREMGGTHGLKVDRTSK